MSFFRKRLREPLTGCIDDDQDARFPRCWIGGPGNELANPEASVKFIVEDGVIPANTIMGLDSRYAIQRIKNSEAEYTAVEDFVMRKSTALRFDFGEIAYRLFDDAFDVLSLTLT